MAQTDLGRSHDSPDSRHWCKPVSENECRTCYMAPARRIIRDLEASHARGGHRRLFESCISFRGTWLARRTSQPCERLDGVRIQFIRDSVPELLADGDDRSFRSSILAAVRIQPLSDVRRGGSIPPKASQARTAIAPSLVDWGLLSTGICEQSNPNCALTRLRCTTGIYE